MPRKLCSDHTCDVCDELHMHEFFHDGSNMVENFSTIGKESFPLRDKQRIALNTYITSSIDDDKNNNENEITWNDKYKKLGIRDMWFNFCYIDGKNVQDYVNMIKKSNMDINGTFTIHLENIQLKHPSGSGITIKKFIEFDISKPESHVKHIQYDRLKNQSLNKKWFFQRASTKTGVEGGLKQRSVENMFGKHAVQGEQLGQSVICADMIRGKHYLDNNKMKHPLDVSQISLENDIGIGVLSRALLIGKNGNQFHMKGCAHEKLFTNHLLCYAVDLNPTRKNKQYNIFTHNVNASDVHTFAKNLLTHQYFLAMDAAIQNTEDHVMTCIVLTMVGGSSFGNDPIWIANGIIRAYAKIRSKYPNVDLKIEIVFGGPTYYKFNTLVDKARQMLVDFCAE